MIVLGSFYYFKMTISDFSDPAAWFLPVLFWGLGGLCLTNLLMVFEIKIQDDDSIAFRNLIRQIVINPYEIKSIKVYFGRKYNTIVYTNGKIKLFDGINNFSDFVSTVKSLNPNIDTSDYEEYMNTVSGVKKNTDIYALWLLCAVFLLRWWLPRSFRTGDWRLVILVFGALSIYTIFRILKKK